jgi:hypothetical protein
VLNFSRLKSGGSLRPLGQEKVNVNANENLAFMRLSVVPRRVQYFLGNPENDPLGVGQKLDQKTLLPLFLSAACLVPCSCYLERHIVLAKATSSLLRLV